MKQILFLGLGLFALVSAGYYAYIADDFARATYHLVLAHILWTEADL